MMTEIVEKYAAMIGLSAADQAAFREMAAKTEPEPEFWAILQAYAEGKRAPIDFLGDLKALTASKGWDEYLFLGTVILFLYEGMHERYREKGISEEIFVRTAMDLKWKVDECRAVFGRPGCFVAWWYQKLFDLSVVCLGRLEFEDKVYDGPDVTVGGVAVKAGDRVIGVHIPSSGEPFTEETCLDAYRKAYAFFGGKDGKKLVFHCSSWLLDPELPAMLGENSRIVRFQRAFRIVSVKESKEGGGTAWRVFGNKYRAAAEDLPEETALQRAYKARLLSGKGWGSAAGVFAFDGEKMYKD